MHHELLSAVARVLALLRHPSLHSCPHTWPQRWYSFFEYRQDLKLPLVLRAQVGSEATALILLADNAISVLKTRPGADCFASLDVLPVAPQRERVLMGVDGAGYRRLARAPASASGCPGQSIPWTEPVQADTV